MGCVCSGKPSSRTCPYHAAVELDTYVRNRLGARALEPGFPLSPSGFGEPVPAKTMLELIITIGTLLGEPLVNKAGQNRIGKHSWKADNAHNVVFVVPLPVLWLHLLDPTRSPSTSPTARQYLQQFQMLQITLPVSISSNAKCFDTNTKK